MNCDHDEFAKLKVLCDDAVLTHDQGVPVVFLPRFKFRAAGRNVEMDLLLRPSSHEIYPTRLFFKGKIEERGQNWKQHIVLGNPWWALSWNHVEAEMGWDKMLCAHLRAVA